MKKFNRTSVHIKAKLIENANKMKNTSYGEYLIEIYGK